MTITTDLDLQSLTRIDIKMFFSKLEPNATKYLVNIIFRQGKMR